MIYLFFYLLIGILILSIIAYLEGDIGLTLAVLLAISGWPFIIIYGSTKYLFDKVKNDKKRKKN